MGMEHIPTRHDFEDIRFEDIQIVSQYNSGHVLDTQKSNAGGIVSETEAPTQERENKFYYVNPIHVRNVGDKDTQHILSDNAPVYRGGILGQTERDTREVEE